MDNLLKTDVLIIGCGIAGSSAALDLADAGLDVTVVTRADDALESNTYYAQGGIIWPDAGEVSQESLVQDIETAGHGYCLPEAVQTVVKDGAAAVPRVLLERLNVPFDLDANGLPLRIREAAHSTERIIHAADATGAAIQKELGRALAEHPRIQLLTKCTAVDLLTLAHHSTDCLNVYKPNTCVGAYLFDRETRKVFRCLAGRTILATGGLGRLFLRTTNPKGARGDGLAMAHRAGARSINTEFIQFHPTTFYHAHASNFLISEAVRGAGARLIDASGKPFMHKYDKKWSDLAPRDVVARGIHQQMLEEGTDNVYLDAASYIDAETIRISFPTIYRECLRYGIDMTREPVPVVPAAHYSCGGVWVDLDGKTTIQSLYAVGEVACTGVHGANRLASNSLLEGLVWGVRAAASIQQDWKETGLDLPAEETIPPWRDSGGEEPDPALIQQDMSAIRHNMWNYVGLIRSGRRLERAMGELRHLENEIERFYRTAHLNDQLIGLRNAVRSAIIVTTAAWTNRKSIGCHYRI